MLCKVKDILIEDRIKGSLVAGAVGDALGYEIEFNSIEDIHKKYGDQGVTKLYHLWGNTFSDDTQMTLFTATGILDFIANKRAIDREGIFDEWIYYIKNAYKDWWTTQIEDYDKSKTYKRSIMNVSRLWVQRAPGNTCMRSIMAGYTDARKYNKSKGCGGVMRVAPIGLSTYIGENFNVSDIFRLGMYAARITHGDEDGYIPAGLFAVAMHYIAHKGFSIDEAFSESLNIGKFVIGDSLEDSNTYKLMRKSLELSETDELDHVDISQLGNGWTGDEALAMAVYACLAGNHEVEGNRLKRTLRIAVNHSGDSDSVGSIAGNIIGAEIGIDAIPAEFIEGIEMEKIIEEVASDLFVSGYNWKEKYII